MQQTTYSKAYEEYCKDTYAKVYRYAMSICGSRQDAEEITQESFLRGLKYFDSFKGDSSFFTWIFKIATNVSKDVLKQKRLMPIEVLEEKGYQRSDLLQEPPDDDPATLYLAKEARYKCLHAIINCLSGEQRQIFCLAITIGLPYKQVAQIMDCSISKVKTTIYRAKQKWFGFMENNCGLMNRNNWCHCEQWINFGLEQGWFERPVEVPPSYMTDEKAIQEIMDLRQLKVLYQSVEEETADQELLDRLRRGIRNHEWKIVSE